MDIKNDTLHKKNKDHGLKGCLFVIIYWTVTFIVGTVLKIEKFSQISAFVFFVGVLIYVLFARPLKNIKGGGSGSSGSSGGGCGGGCGGGGCGG